MTIRPPPVDVIAMSVTLRAATMTRDQFFDWAEVQEGRYEFDGFQPVAMTGGSLNRNRIAFNIHFALRQRLGRTGCRALGMDAGVATVGDTVRYPDAVVTCSPAGCHAPAAARRQPLDPRSAWAVSEACMHARRNGKIPICAH